MQHRHMKRTIYILAVCVLVVSGMMLSGCGKKTSAVEQRRAEKHVRDSVALMEQERSLAYYQSQLEILAPQADSLLALFKYEKIEKYQDHGYYVATGKNGLRVKVRDDGKGDILLYREGKRIESADDEAFERAQHLHIVINDINELEKRIQHTSLEVQKYQKRLQKQ